MERCSECVHNVLRNRLNHPPCYDCFQKGHKSNWKCKEIQHHDSHYQTDVQPLEVMQANMTPEEFQGFLKGNIIKYVCRCGRKDEPLKEAEKVQRYAEWLVKALKGEKIDPRK